MSRVLTDRGRAWSSWLFCSKTRRTACVLFFGILVVAQARAQQNDKCRILCTPKFKFEPTVTVSNLFGGARVAELENGKPVKIVEEEREAEFEMILAMDIPTQVPRVGLTVEAIWAPFGGASKNPFTRRTAHELARSEIRDNPVELELELNLAVLEPEQTREWVEMHFDIVDKFSPAERPNAGSVYTHKLNFELDTAFAVFKWLPKGNWLRNLELELSLDYMATGIPRAEDQVPLGQALFLENASPWSLSLVFVIPVAPLFE